MQGDNRFISFLTARCPKCQEGSVFSGVYAMNPTCPDCGLKFEREPGYFAGAMPVSYAIGFFITLPLVMFLLMSKVPTSWIIAAPMSLLVLLSPLIFRYSRLVWLYLDRNLEE